MTITYTAPVACASTTTALTYQNTEGIGVLTVYDSVTSTAISTNNSLETLTILNGTYTVAISMGCMTTLTTIIVDGVTTTIPSNTVLYSTVTFDGSHTIICISTCVH